jgi:hypothetical protein
MRKTLIIGAALAALAVAGPAAAANSWNGAPAGTTAWGVKDWSTPGSAKASGATWNGRPDASWTTARPNPSFHFKVGANPARSGARIPNPMSNRRSSF